MACFLADQETRLELKNAVISTGSSVNSIPGPFSIREKLMSKFPRVLIQSTFGVPKYSDSSKMDLKRAMHVLTHSI